MNTVNRAKAKYNVKTSTAILLFLLILAFLILSATACAPEEKQIEIATCSLDHVIQIAMEHSPECRLKLPGEKGKG
jgi:hypothetical protein